MKESVTVKTFLVAELEIFGNDVSGTTLILESFGHFPGTANLQVESAYYDVELAEKDNCVSFSNACDDVIDFTFRSKTDATQEATSLIDKVLSISVNISL